jgi:hypothetical protein
LAQELKKKFQNATASIETASKTEAEMITFMKSLGFTRNAKTKAWSTESVINAHTDTIGEKILLRVTEEIMQAEKNIEKMLTTFRDGIAQDFEKHKFAPMQERQVDAEVSNSPLPTPSSKQKSMGKKATAAAKRAASKTARPKTDMIEEDLNVASDVEPVEELQSDVDVPRRLPAKKRPRTDDYPLPIPEVTNLGIDVHRLTSAPPMPWHMQGPMNYPMYDPRWPPYPGSYAPPMQVSDLSKSTLVQSTHTICSTHRSTLEAPGHCTYRSTHPDLAIAVQSLPAEIAQSVAVTKTAIAATPQ